MKLKYEYNYMFCVDYGYKDTRYWKCSSIRCEVRVKAENVEKCLYTAKLPYGKVSVRQNLLKAKFLKVKIRHSQTFLRRNFLAAKLPLDKISHGDIFQYEISYGENSGNDF